MIIEILHKTLQIRSKLFKNMFNCEQHETLLQFSKGFPFEAIEVWLYEVENHVMVGHRNAHRHFLIICLSILGAKM